ncbi:PAC motif-containing protein, partial [Tanacetum coccineum]
HQTTSSHQLTIRRPRAFQEFDRVTNAGILEPLTTKLTKTQYLNVLQSVGQAFKHGIIFWNRAAEKLYGYTAVEAYGGTPIEILVDPKDTLMAKFLQERAAYGENWAGEFPIINKHGERFVVFCTNTPYCDEDSRLLGAICISSDAHTNQVVKLGMIVCVPTPVISARHGHNYQKPLQTSTASNISNFVFVNSRTNKDSDVFSIYSQLCAQNVQARCSSNSPQPANSSRFGTTQHPDLDVFKIYSHLYAKSTTARSPTTSLETVHTSIVR